MNLLTKLIATARGVTSHPLHHHARLQALWQFGVRQLAARFVAGEICVPFPDQTRLIVPPRMKGAAHFIMPGLCEFEPMSFVAHFLRPDNLFVDVGANLGAYTVLASGVARAQSICLEPSPTAYRHLLRTIRLNQLEPRVSPHNTAVGAQAGTLRLTDDLGTENFVCPTDQDFQGVAVPVTTLDHLVRELNPALLKIDVEGYETEVVAGSRQTLQMTSLHGLIIERAGNASRYGHDELALHRQIQTLGFIPCAYQPFARRLDQLPPEALGNIIYLRDMDSARKRLQEAPAFEFAGQKI